MIDWYYGDLFDEVNEVTIRAPWGEYFSRKPLGITTPHGQVRLRQELWDRLEAAEFDDLGLIYTFTVHQNGYKEVTDKDIGRLKEWCETTKNWRRLVIDSIMKISDPIADN